MIQNRFDLCGEISKARREAGLSQQALADKIGTTREKIARLEGGTGSIALLIRAMSAIPVRLLGIAKGLTVIDQLANACERRSWNVQEVARAAGLDARTVRAVMKGAGTVASLEKIIIRAAPRAKRQQVTRQYWDYDRGRMAETDCRFTPPEFLAAVTEAFGPIELDPCWHPESNVVAARTISLPECGLSADWASNGLTYINPPFGDVASWIRKANDEWERGAVTKQVLLFPASRLDIREFFDRSIHKATTLILRERLRFHRSSKGGMSYPAPFALVLACWGCTGEEIQVFRSRYPSLLLSPQQWQAAA